ncbi:hypothetical protein SAMN04244572_04887 [Azotobacter beijerinckii]|uniref:Uncharacterized protein n=1 Tax=Azotobacter beijerinckii TaxID=170623 RepID=A0A1H7B0L0_9GAMM|nr:hypothetical protein SAMN04244572_04887 [Azotobacter beijerinckii]
MNRCKAIERSLFANRMSVLVHDGVGVWLTARRLHQGRFFLLGVRHGAELELDAGHFIKSDS